MIETVSAALTDNGVAKDKILFELFTSSSPETTANEAVDGKVIVSVVLDDDTHSLEMDAKEIVLDAVLKANIDAPYSCQGECVVLVLQKLLKGKPK